MTRNQKILQHIDRTGVGIEIGPSHSPVAPRRNGFNVEIIDHLDRPGLINKYQGQGLNLENIEEVDYVWRGESYQQLTGRQHHYDWIIASHVIEHTPDLVGFLNSCEQILKDTGVLSLVIPDKRYCFDRYRPLTGLAQVIDSHLNQNTIHSPGTVADYFLNVGMLDGSNGWDSAQQGQFRFSHTVEAARENMETVRQHHTFIDVHAWCFVPHAFRLLISDLHHLGFTALREVAFYATSGCEFYMTLGRQGAGLDQPRLRVLEVIEQEVSGARPGRPAGTLRQLARRYVRPVLTRLRNQGKVTS